MSQTHCSGAAIGLLAIVLIHGCGVPSDDTESPPSGTPAFTARDSAGVSISESRDSAWTRATAWSVDPDPLLEIGRHDAMDDGPAFGRIGPVRLLLDGRVAVGDIQAMEVLVFLPDGTPDATWSGPGDGPGEIRSLDEISVLSGDEIVLTNAASRRLLGVWLDELDVEHVRLHRIVKPNGEGAR